MTYHRRRLYVFRLPNLKLKLKSIWNMLSITKWIKHTIVFGTILFCLGVPAQLDNIAKQTKKLIYQGTQAAFSTEVTGYLSTTLHPVSSPSYGSMEKTKYLFTALYGGRGKDKFDVTSVSNGRVISTNANGNLESSHDAHALSAIRIRLPGDSL